MGELVCKVVLSVLMKKSVIRFGGAGENQLLMLEILRLQGLKSGRWRCSRAQKTYWLRTVRFQAILF
jgi:hypothetical protein